MGRFTQGVARGLALPWANEWLRLWREARIGSHARIDGENSLGFMSGMPQPSDGGLPKRGLSRNRAVEMPGMDGAAEGRDPRTKVRIECGFVSHNIGGEVLRRRDCPEFERGKAKG